ncbi:hypothetical protein ONE63_011183 [Megalurothrips usitatus]|uniref:RNA-directed DNA polymerase n=1 Tax=Megalurothrips usitatus TaxID=439358 RepID=A0AAV7X3Y8_9NEOP|nr:hypothetical protein ONE63_011183 [Megalurothrips usitatus]
MFNQEFPLVLFVCQGLTVPFPLFGRPWLDVIVPNWRNLLEVSNIAVIFDCKVPQISELKAMFPRVFDSEADTPIEGYSARLVLKDNAIPVKHRAYKIPFGLTDVTNNLLDQWTQSGRAIRVRQAEWASPCFPVPKKDNSYRLVVDFKKSLNPQLRVDFYPIPSPEEIFAELSDCSVFVSLDLKDAYMQVPLHKDSQELCVVTTPKGFYKLTRLVYGVASAAAIFQNVMEEILFNIPKVKSLLQSDKVLMFYNPKLPIVLYTDASPYGLGVALCHTVTINGKPMDRPVMLWSCTLNQAQQNYAQIDREGLAVIAGVTKAHRFIWGRRFTLVTDCEAISRIFSPSKSLPVRTGHRLQHWATILQAYDYKLVHKKAEHLVVADALSRLPSPARIEDIQINALNVKVATEIPLTCDKIAVETQSDPVLQKVFRFVHLGWPPKDQIKDNPSLGIFFKVRDVITIQSKVLLFSSRIIIPDSVKAEVLRMIHEGHPGIVRSKLLARQFIWWPQLNEDISNLVSNCSVCALVNFAPQKLFVSWTPPSSPFERVHIDFYEKNNVSYLIVCDAYSKWVDIILMSSTNAPLVIEKLMSIFSIFGLPKILVSDNGQPFDSDLYANFCTQFDIKIVHSPPYSPESNGQAERCVGIAKKGVEKIVLARNTPSTVTGKTPNELLFNFRPRTLLSKLLPSKNVPLSETHFRDGEIVVFRLNKKSPVVKGEIVKSLGPNRYVVSIAGVHREVHHNQLNRST